MTSAGDRVARRARLGDRGYPGVMPAPFPTLAGPYALPDGGSWSAEFESYDMRMDTAYYFVTRDDGDEVLEFFVRAHVSGGVPDEEALLAQVRPHAERGEANTDYEGSMMWRLRRRRAAAEREQD